MDYYETKGQWANVQYFGAGGTYADGRAVSGATTTPLFQSGSGNPSYPARVKAKIWEHLRMPLFNALVDGALPANWSNFTMGNVAFINDQTGGWANITARGVIAFNAHAPFIVNILSGATESHGYVILNKVRTDGSGVNIKGAGVVDLRKVTDSEIDDFGHYSIASGQDSGILILKNKTAASNLSSLMGTGYKAVALLNSSGGGITALDGGINIGSNVVQNPMQSGYAFQGNAKEWMDALNTGLNNAAYTGSWVPANSEPPQSQPGSVMNAATFASLGANVPSSATWPNPNLTPNTPAYVP